MKDWRKKLDTKRSSRNSVDSRLGRELFEGVGEVDLADCFGTECQRVNFVKQDGLLHQILDVLQSEGNT